MNQTNVSDLALLHLKTLVAERTHPDKWLRSLMEAVGGMDEQFDQAVRRLGHVEGWGNRVAAMQHINKERTYPNLARNTVLLALYCIRQFPDDTDAQLDLAQKAPPPPFRNSESVVELITELMLKKTVNPNESVYNHHSNQ